MKKLLYAAALLIGCTLTAQANPGDTTWVQANHVNLDYYNNFDTSVAFPDGTTSYRKILMIFTLGQYNCPSGTQYCHQWDYTVQNYLMTKGGDTMELSRLITPYANSGWSRFGSSWQQPYVFDVTDFYPLLKDTAGVRIHYSGYSGGFTADIKFAFIEGTPDRNVTGIKQLYDFSHSYGDTANPINNALVTIADTAPAATQSATLKYIVTGHGNDDNGCCEFAAHNYQVNLNGNTIATHTLWRDDCGLNELYPQGGTWVYERANWCPGALVRPLYHNLPGITAGTPFDINIQFDPYTGSGSLGSYTSNAIIFFHSGFNKTVDASVDEILAPTTNPDYYRENPSGSIPRILVHNSGADTITNIDFSYGVKDSLAQTYTWNGSLAPLGDTIISLPALAQLTNMSIGGATGTYEFTVQINGVNGPADEDSTNNKLTSEFNVAPVWPGDLILSLKTSNITSSFTIGNPHQSWEITDMAGNVVASRDNTSASTTYTDTVPMPAAGFYKLTIKSGNGMGLHWWPFDGSNQVTPGYFSVKNMSGTKLPMKNYAYSGQAHDDWGVAYSQYFTVAEAGHTAVSDVMFEDAIRIYPNPANDFIRVDFAHKPAQANSVALVNVLGQKVYQSESTGQHLQINTQAFAAGVYTLLINNGNNQVKSQKVVIRK